MFFHFKCLHGQCNTVMGNMLPTGCGSSRPGVICLIMAVIIPLKPNTSIVPKKKAKIFFLQFQLLLGHGSVNMSVVGGCFTATKFQQTKSLWCNHYFIYCIWVSLALHLNIDSSNLRCRQQLPPKWTTVLHSYKGTQIPGARSPW
jgi:hypothetical protein